ncbi:MAG: hypothetical protein Q9184_007454, partial [Pyrenodesmia sp. 2 TL-2023]
SLQLRIFVIFQTSVLPALILAQVEPKYDLLRLIFYRESAAKAYRQFPFALSMVLAEMPYSILCAVGFFLPIYYMPKFQPSSSRAGYQFFMILLMELFSVTLGQALAALTPSAFIALLLNPFVIVVFAMFCGVTVPPPQIPGFWRKWLYQLDPLTRLIGGMVVTELHDRPVVCTQSELNVFSAPDGQTCGDYMASFFANDGPGYIVNNATSLCEYCAYKVGDEFSQPLGLDFNNRWRDLGVYAAFVLSNLFLLFLGSRVTSTRLLIRLPVTLGPDYEIASLASRQHSKIDTMAPSPPMRHQHRHRCGFAGVDFSYFPYARFLFLLLLLGFFSHLVMPYHLLERPQQAKNILCHNAEDLPHDTRNRLRRGGTQRPPPSIAELPASTRYQSIPRVSPPHATHSTKHPPRASAGLSIILCGIITALVLWALYLLYTRLQRRSGCRCSPNHKKVVSPAASTDFRDDRRRGPNSPWHIRGLSFGGSRRRKAPPPSLDLEALKPAKGQRKGLWASLPEAVQGKGSAGTVSSSTQKRDGVDSAEGSSSTSAWSSSSAYSAGAGASLIAQMVPERVRSAVAGSAWGSGESLVDRIRGEEEGQNGMLVTEEGEDGELGLGRYFEDGGVGIKREWV